MRPHKPVIWTSIHLTLFKQQNSRCPRVHRVLENLREKMSPRRHVFWHIFLPRQPPVVFFPKKISQSECVQESRRFCFIPVSNSSKQTPSAVHKPVVVLLKHRRKIMQFELSQQKCSLAWSVLTELCQVRDNVLRPASNQTGLFLDTFLSLKGSKMEKSEIPEYLHEPTIFYKRHLIADCLIYSFSLEFWSKL